MYECPHPNRSPLGWGHSYIRSTDIVMWSDPGIRTGWKQKKKYEKMNFWSALTFLFLNELPPDFHQSSRMIWSYDFWFFLESEIFNAIFSSIFEKKSVLYNFKNNFSDFSENKNWKSLKGEVPCLDYFIFYITKIKTAYRNLVGSWCRDCSETLGGGLGVIWRWKEWSSVDKNTLWRVFLVFWLIFHAKYTVALQFLCPGMAPL